MKQSIDHAVSICDALNVLSKATSENMCANSNDDQFIAPSVGNVEDTTVICDAGSSVSSSAQSIQKKPSGINAIHSTDFFFKSKGLQMANLNIHHLLSKLDVLCISMACGNGPDIFGICETFLNNNISSNELIVIDFDHISEDRRWCNFVFSK